MGNNFYFGGNDPLLSGGMNYDAKVAEIEKMSQALDQQKLALRQAKEQMLQQGHQPQQSRTPVWDEIDSITSAMTDNEYDKVINNEEFIQSQNAIMAVLQQKYMQMMRPVVEESPEGKQALEYHLTLIKRLRNAASTEVDKEIREFAEYKEKYSHMSYDEYLKTRRTDKKSKK